MMAVALFYAVVVANVLPWVYWRRRAVLAERAVSSCCDEAYSIDLKFIRFFCCIYSVL